MATTTQGNTLSDYLVWEQELRFSRAVVTMTNVSAVPGMVMGKITASGYYTQLDPDALTGESAAAGICVGTYDASSADVAGAIINSDSVWRTDNLVWITGISAGEKTTALGELLALRMKPVLEEE